MVIHLKEEKMFALKNEHIHETIGERWEALDKYLLCITECDLSDKTCVTRCLVHHLKIDDGTEEWNQLSSKKRTGVFDLVPPFINGSCLQLIEI